MLMFRPYQIALKATVRKDPGVNVAEWDAQDLKDQLKSHHTTALGQLASSSTHFKRREGQKVEICEAPV